MFLRNRLVILGLILLIVATGCERVTKPYPGTKGGKTIAGPTYSADAKANPPLSR